jgi:hypothetical protein
VNTCHWELPVNGIGWIRVTGSSRWTVLGEYMSLGGFFLDFSFSQQHVSINSYLVKHYRLLIYLITMINTTPPGNLLTSGCYGISEYHPTRRMYSYLFFRIIQCQWHKHGSDVLENTLLILRGWGNTSSSVGFASGGRRYCLINLSGFGGYFPIPPRHAYAIVSIRGW